MTAVFLNSTLTCAAREVLGYSPDIRPAKFREELAARKVDYDSYRFLADEVLRREVADFERSYDRFVKPRGYGNASVVFH